MDPLRSTPLTHPTCLCLPLQPAPHPSLPPPPQVALWDLRNMTSKLHLFERHDEEVFQVGGSGG